MGAIILGETNNRSPATDAYSAIVLADTPRAYWKMGETSGTQMTDSSGNGYHGTYQSNYTLNQTSPIAGSSTGSVQKTATGGYLAYMPAGAFPASSAVTMECWTKWSASTMFSYGINWYGGGGERVWFQHFPWSDGLVYFDAGQTSSVGYDRISWNPANIGLTVTSNWHHWVFIKNETTDEQKIYVDGILRVGGSGLTAPGMTTQSVGQGQMMADWYGYLSDVAIYNYELTQAQIDEHYQAGRYGSAGAGYGELWSKTGTDATLMFTNDMGVAGGVLARENSVFTPKIWDLSFSDAEGQTYGSNNAGRFEIVNGRLVVGTIYLDLTSKGTISGGPISIGGLPYTVVSGKKGFAHCERATNLTGFDSSANKIIGYCVDGSNRIVLWYSGSTSGSTSLQATQITNSTQLHINFAYEYY